MPQFFSNKRLIVLLISIIFLVAFIGYSLSDRERLTWPEQFMKDTVSWVQTVFSKPAHFVAGFFENVSEMRNLYEENKLLKARLEEFAQVSVERNLLKEENHTLKEMLEVEESLQDYQLRQALVIHRHPDRWSEYIGINRGAMHGVTANMAVISANGGLIGKIRHVGQFSSTVQLLTDPDPTNRVSAMVLAEDERVLGFIEGMDKESERLMIKKMNIDAEIEEGQLVTTSGLGGIYPDGLVIGEIDEIEPDEFGLTKNAYIRPKGNFYHLDYVMVIERSSTMLETDVLEEEEES